MQLHLIGRTSHPQKYETVAEIKEECNFLISGLCDAALTSNMYMLILI
jgi:hypothetical protein